MDKKDQENIEKTIQWLKTNNKPGFISLSAILVDQVRLEDDAQYFQHLKDLMENLDLIETDKHGWAVRLTVNGKRFIGFGKQKRKKAFDKFWKILVGFGVVVGIVYTLIGIFKSCNDENKNPSIKLDSLSSNKVTYDISKSSIKPNKANDTPLIIGKSVKQDSVKPK